jgi:tetratricopeptide (TPR) repeat protein
MMLERHYDEESLIAMLHAGDASASSDPHLSGCTSCTDMLESYRVISEVLGAKIVWEPQEMPNEAGAARGVAAIRAFATSMERENEDADALVTELLSSPRQWWVATVERDKRYHTAGVVTRLVEASEGQVHVAPLDAVELAAAAIAVGNELPVEDGTLQLLGAAYRQHAYSLFYVGDFVHSLESVELGRSTFEQCTVSAYALARLDIVRALVLGAQNRFNEGIQIARSAAQTFREFGERRRLASALMTYAYLLLSAHNYRDALGVLRDIEKNFEADVDPYTRALTFHNLGACYQGLRDNPSALRYYQISVALYEENHAVTQAAGVRYNVGLLLLAEGKRPEAKKRLSECQVSFQQLGMVHDAVVAGLDLAEIALLENNFQEVEELCRAAIRQFEVAGVAHSQEALTALTFLREAAEQRRATQETIWHVKTYIRRLPDQPALLFAPAPLPPG